MSGGPDAGLREEQESMIRGFGWRRFKKPPTRPEGAREKARRVRQMQSGKCIDPIAIWHYRGYGRWT
jgi:hypothetical protein